MTTVPFQIPDHLGGLAECSGLLKLDGTTLRVELQSQDAILGVLKSKVRKVEISLEKIESIAFKKSLFSAKLLLRLSDYDLYSDIPNPGDGELIFKIKKRYSVDAAELTSTVKLATVEQQLKRIDDQLAG